MHIVALQLAACAGLEVIAADRLPHLGEQVVEILADGIVRVGHVAQRRGGEQATEHAALHLLLGALGVGARLTHDAVGIEPHGRLKELPADVVDGLLLTFARGILHGVASGHIVVIARADVLSHVVQIAVILSLHGLPHLAQVVVAVVVLVGPLGQSLDDALQVLDAVVRGLDAVVAQVLGLCAGVGVAALAAEPQARVAAQNLRRFGHQFLLLLILVLELRPPLVAPLDGPLVVVVDAREETTLRDVVLRLCHVVEAGVVHDRGGVAVLLHPLLVPQLLHGRGKRGAHVVAQTQRVAHLVRGDEADELAHELLVELHRAGPLVRRGTLHHVPLRQQVHHLVKPADVALDDLARARVADVRAVGVLRLRRQIAQHAVAGVVETHVGAVRGPFAANDGILESGGLEGHVPVVDARDEVGHPLLRRGRVDVVDDLLLRLHQLALSIGLLVLRLQTVARDEGLVVRLVLVVREAREAADEVAHALVPEPFAHRLLGQQHDARVEAQGDAARMGGSRGGAGLRAVGAGGLHLNVDGEDAQRVDERAVLLRPADFQATAGLAVDARQVVLAFKEAGHFDEGLVARLVAADHLEGRDDRVDGRLRQRLRDAVVGIGQLAQHILAQEQLRCVAPLEVDRGVGHLLA